MTKCYGSTMDIYLAWINIKKLHVSQGHSCESLVNFVEIYILNCHALSLQKSLTSLGWGNTEINGGNLSILISDDSCKRFQTSLLGCFLSHQNNSASTIINLRCVSCGNSSILSEGRLQAGELIWKEFLALLILTVSLFLSLVVSLHNINDLPIKNSLLLSLSCLVIRLYCVLILCLSGDAKLAADLLCARAHKNVVVNVCESIELNRIHSLDVAIPGGLSQEEIVRGLRHALEATSYNGVPVADSDGSGADHYGLHATGTDLVDCRGGSVDTHSRAKCHLSCWGLPTAG